MNTEIWLLSSFYILYQFYSGSTGEPLDADDFCAFMMPYFSPVIFSGFGDGANGFYSVYSGVFNDIMKFEKYICS